MAVTMALQLQRQFRYCILQSSARRLTPPFYRHILDQNAGIANGTVNGTVINLKYLGIGNGLTVSHSITRLPMREPATAV